MNSRNKYLITIVSMLLILLISGLIAKFQIMGWRDELKIYINNIPVVPSDRDGQYRYGSEYVPLSFEVKGTTYVPLQFAFEIAGFNVIWNDGTKRVDAYTETLPNIKSHMVTIAGHRGFKTDAPENTLASFRAAIEKKVDYIEFDMQMTRDGTPVIIHDLSVDRTTNGKGNVKDLTIMELERFDAGSWFNKKFTGEKIPQLKDVLELAKQNHVGLYAEIKDYRNKEDITIMVKQILDAGFEENSVICSFRHEDFQFVRNISKKVKIGLLVGNDFEGFMKSIDEAIKYKEAILFVDYSLISKYPKLVNLAHQYGIEISVWTVNDKAIGNKLIKDGVNSIVTDKITIFK